LGTTGAEARIAVADDAERGWRDYNRPLLAVYDRVVIGFVAEAVWRCPPEPLLALYRDNIRPPHLDVGPGTGYIIDRSGLPDRSPVTLVDPNPTVLAYATRRLRRLDVTGVRASVLEPLPVARAFPSAALNLVLHCLPGPMTRKAAAIRNIASVLEPDGVLFGATVLGLAGDQTRLSRAVLRLFNRRGAFDNLGDTEAGLRTILEESFTTVDLSVVGAIAMFVARSPRVPA
jgi:SAM-dependent methyltransferase